MLLFSQISPPAKWLIAFLVIVLGLSFLFAPEPHPVNYSDISFTTTASSRLYFRNVRSYYYDVIPDKPSRFILNKLKRRMRDSSHASLQFTIIENPIMDEAYLYAQLIGPSGQYADHSIWILTNNDSISSQIKLDQLNNEGYYLLGAKTFEALLKGWEIYLVNDNNQKERLFTNRKLVRNTEIVLEDYFKLTGKL